jgi:L-cysteine:1D-myo-inositol 2-amino-2-deoxy-alpha-D-glucopyranoside ligase
MAIRLALLSSHYRTDRAWTPDLLRTAEQRLGTWRRAVAVPAAPPALPVVADVRERLADDLDSPGAIARVDAWAAEALAHGDGAPELDDTAPALVRDAVDALLGIALVPRTAR